VRGVLHSGATDLSANEELKFLRDLGDPFELTATTDAATEESLLHQQFPIELNDFIDTLLSDGRLTQQEGVKLRSAVTAASGRQFNPEAALAALDEILGNARP
jgi:hypothetical protein